MYAKTREGYTRHVKAIWDLNAKLLNNKIVMKTASTEIHISILKCCCEMS